MHTRRPARLKHLSYLGIQRYSLTFCTDWRRELFTDAEAVSLVLSQFLRVCRKEEFVILAYCFMPDHVHLLIEGVREDADARKFIVKAKQCSAHAYASRFGQRLWQPFGYEHVLRDDEGSGRRPIHRRESCESGSGKDGNRISVCRIGGVRHQGVNCDVARRRLGSTKVERYELLDSILPTQYLPAFTKERP